MSTSTLAPLPDLGSIEERIDPRLRRRTAARLAALTAACEAELQRFSADVWVREARHLRVHPSDAGRLVAWIGESSPIQALDLWTSLGFQESYDVCRGVVEYCRPGA